MDDLTLDDFDFALPEELIALRPARPRPASRLLVARGDGIADAHVADLADFLRPGDLLVFNDTRVIPARLRGTRTRDSAHGDGVSQVEVMLAHARPDGSWDALARPAKRLRAGDVIRFAGDLSAEVISRDGAMVALRFDRTGPDFDAALEAAGEMPLPPYIESRRAADEQDLEDYQTVFARVRGAVAAPTASLHFDDALLARLAEAGVQSTFVTLHVGAGTFLPVKVENIALHRMHAEWGEVTEEAAAAIAAARARGGRVIPVGTTALRLIEAAARGGTIAPFRGDTDIFIRPGFAFHVADGLMTNFHLPKSTLMMLVSALMGVDRIRRIYDHAIAGRYRFFSYGDSSLLLPDA
ncbi:tRNA preQ1(34) S-adenosylmethionine ribosyltransferase-isomerase QueA [Halovulum dunhuangense]|uniref:S-adenosylmethionine:tRNA ribosyltransferase-isomerase n=1 Tax=Halovulum dunhuangense TaxID=1505036 RepID=A0A849L342_9RHOB|nr:tRNA preQ1(34) S-adenosylmethionine ribosyltransferase-isomerase QueA [Halovulum dunhuangense]NNU80650.1 tRNA preQ1(34) S-adenosylmethionine ribosyltransferase-isomerase QueA [Halovulum dunhuangense]